MIATYLIQNKIVKIKRVSGDIESLKLFARSSLRYIGNEIEGINIDRIARNLKAKRYSMIVYFDGGYCDDCVFQLFPNV